MDKVICEAIKSQKRVKIVYDGSERIIEPHTFGLDKNGNGKIRASQASGYSESGNPNLKLFSVHKISQVKLLEDNFNVNSFYRSGSDKGIPEIICQI